MSFPLERTSSDDHSSLTSYSGQPSLAVFRFETLMAHRYKDGGVPCAGSTQTCLLPAVAVLCLASKSISGCRPSHTDHPMTHPGPLGMKPLFALGIAVQRGDKDKVEYAGPLFDLTSNK